MSLISSKWVVAKKQANKGEDFHKTSLYARLDLMPRLVFGVLVCVYLENRRLVLERRSNLAPSSGMEGWIGVIQNSNCCTCVFDVRSHFNTPVLLRSHLSVKKRWVALSCLLSSGHLARVDIMSSVFTEDSLSELLNILLNAHHHTFRPSQIVTLINMEMCWGFVLN